MKARKITPLLEVWEIGTKPKPSWAPTPGPWSIAVDGDYYVNGIDRVFKRLDFLAKYRIEK